MEWRLMFVVVFFLCFEMINAALIQSNPSKLPGGEEFQDNSSVRSETTVTTAKKVKRTRRAGQAEFDLCEKM